MKEKPILFNAEMVKAVLSGRKTQTRRVMKPQPYKYKFGSIGMSVWRWLYKKKYEFQEQQNWINACPYGRVGERLWVRETFTGCDLPGFGDIPCIVYDDEWEGDEYKPREARPWARKFGRIPSIHMPRDASRINLEITDIRVERVQEMTNKDAITEGIRFLDRDSYGMQDNWGLSENNYNVMMSNALSSFILLWNSINKKRGYGWDVNPWVWVVEFKPC